VVLGTGLTECILSGVLSVEGKKVGRATPRRCWQTTLTTLWGGAGAPHGPQRLLWRRQRLTQPDPGMAPLGYADNGMYTPPLTP
jgi:hypothetical protein